jgi:hypothetical protein
MTCVTAFVRAGTVLALLGLTAGYPVTVHTQTGERPKITVKSVDDFQVTGTGDHAAWGQTDWVPMRRRQPEAHPYDTRF